MSEKWTKGPWLMQQPEEDGAIFIVGDDLGGLVGAALPWPTEAEQGGSERVKANAHLIAAAPDLYEALTEGEALIAGDLVGVEWKQACASFLANARAALSRARGE